jgi:uncharacterized SAM-binding protein YcdF (DUF218 family)
MERTAPTTRAARVHDAADSAARTLWDYLQMRQPLRRCEAIFCLCSMDDRVAVRAAQLYERGHGNYVIFSGGIAHRSDALRPAWAAPEAEHFAEVAVRHGTPPDKILIENRARNTGENIRFTYQLLQERNLHPNSLLLVQKPYMERRAYATFKKQWPNPGTGFIVTSPQIPYDEYFNSANPKERIINIMVGDLQRVREYPKAGYQVRQTIPHEVWRAYKQLVRLGYTEHLVS